MRHNEDTYHLIHVSQKELFKSKGFDSVNTSTDGVWFMGGKGDTISYEDEISWPIELPQYIKDLGITSPVITHKQALLIRHTTAATRGSSDGWFFPKEINQ